MLEYNVPIVILRMKKKKKMQLKRELNRLSFNRCKKETKTARKVTALT